MTSSADLFKQGQSYRSQRKFKKAVEVFSQLVEREPENAEYWYYLGVSHDNRGEEVKAIPCYEKALQIGLSDRYKGNAHAFLASSYLRTKDTTRAALEISTLLESNEQHELLDNLQRRLKLQQRDR